MVFDCGHGLLLWFSSTTKKIRSIFVSFFFLVCLKSNQFDFEFFCFCNTEKRKKCLSNNRLIDFIIIRYVDHWKILVLFFSVTKEFFRCWNSSIMSPTTTATTPKNSLIQLALKKFHQRHQWERRMIIIIIGIIILALFLIITIILLTSSNSKYFKF